MKENNSLERSLIEVHNALLRLQRRMRKVRLGYHYPIPLTAPEAIILSLIAREPELTPKQVAQLVDLQKSKVSRVLAGLEREGYLQVLLSDNDRRQRILKFTEEGAKLLDELDEINTAIALDGCSALTASERAQVARFLRALASGLGSPPVVKRPNEDILVPEQRRMIQITGMIAKEYMGSGLDIAAYQLLFALAEAEMPLRFLQLADLLPFEGSRLSRQLTEWTEKGYVKRGSIAGDKRGSSYRLTDKGRKRFETLQREVAVKLAEALKRVSKREIDHFVVLVQKVIAGPIPSPGRVELVLTRCVSKRHYQTARAFLVEAFVKKEQHHDLESQLIPESSLCFLVHYKGVTLGLAEFSEEQGRCRARNLVAIGELEAIDKFLAMLRVLISELFRIHPTATILMYEKQIGRKSAQILGMRTAQNGEISLDNLH